MSNVVNITKCGPWTDPVTDVAFLSRQIAEGRTVAAVVVSDAAPYRGRETEGVVALTDEQAAAMFAEGE
jgi:hypothetical protein